MTIEQIFKSKIYQPNSSYVLRKGQIVTGKIQKIYPNQQAQIQIGSQQIFGHINAPLVVGERYFFQVNVKDNRLFLKVLSGQEKNASHNLESLMKRLGVRMNRSYRNVLQYLITKEIPFDLRSIHHAVDLFNQSKNKKVAQNILGYMFLEGYPITKSIFNALYAVQTEQFSDRLLAVLHKLQQQTTLSPLEELILQRIQSYISEQQTFSKVLTTQIRYEAHENHDRMYQLFQKLFLLDFIPKDQWQSTWLSAQKEQTNSSPLPFSLNIENLLSTFYALYHQEKLLQNNAQRIYNQWSKPIHEALNNQTTLQEEQFYELFRTIQEEIVIIAKPLEESILFKTFKNDLMTLQRLLIFLEALQDHDVFDPIRMLLLQLDQENEIIKNRFFKQLDRTRWLSGITDEHSFTTNNALHPSYSLKTLLIQWLESSSAKNQEAMQHLLDYLNGLQLKSVHETASMIQASLQVPGYKLQLNHDLQIEFESKKTDQHTIDPDYCRILFYLHLKNLHETVIDLRIQDRLISIYVYNDQPEIKEMCHMFRPSFEKALDQLNYQLSAIHVQALRKDQSTYQGKRETKPMANEGIDYRV